MSPRLLQLCSYLPTAGFAAALILFCAPDARAQKYQFLGPNKCVNCHDHDPEKKWWEKEDGPPPNGHINALNQMETPKSAVYAKAIGLADPYDAKGSCVRCHATVFKGEANAGISCESCHGPGSGYVDVHQEKGSYQKALAVGLLDVVKKPQTWVPICVQCHVMDDPKLVAAGHPSGDNFDVGAKYPIVSKHFKTQPDKGTVSSIGRASFTSIVAKRGGAKPPAAATEPPPAAPAAPATTPPAATPAAPRGSPPPAAAPPATARPTAPAARPTPAPAAPPTPSLPPTPAAPPTPPEVAAPAGAPVPETPPPSALPRSPAAAVAAVQGRALALLDALLRRDARAPIRVTPPEPKTTYRGADAELLRLQEEVLRLALEALGTAPKKPDQK
jgi:Cytochrome c554 and c-prime